MGAAPLRIAFVTPEYVTEENFSGGLANYLHRVSLSLLALGHDPAVIVSSGRNESFRQGDIEVHRVKVEPGVLPRAIGRLTSYRYTASLGFLRTSYVLNRRVREIHAACPVSLVQYPHLGGIGFFRLGQVPSVVRLSSYTPLWRLHGEYDHMPPLVLRQQEMWERRGLMRADAVFGPCREVAAVVARDLGKPVDVIETPFLMDTDKWDESVYAEHLKGKRYLLYVGRFSIAKGLVAIAESIRELLGRHPEIHFVFAGREQGGYKGTPMMEHVLRMAGKYRDRVLNLGSFGHDRLYPIMKRSVAVVMPSLIENFPNVCLEAMALGQVVIGTRRSGFEQLIEEGESGLLCEPGNAASLLQAMERAILLPEEEREAIGAGARRRIDELRPEKAVARLLSFYEEVIGRKRRGGRPAAVRKDGAERS